MEKHWIIYHDRDSGTVRATHAYGFDQAKDMAANMTQRGEAAWAYVAEEKCKFEAADYGKARHG